MEVAYLDPGSGSIIATALVGGAAAAGVVFKSARARVGGLLSRKEAKGAEPDSEPEAGDAESSSPADVDS